MKILLCNYGGREPDLSDIIFTAQAIAVNFFIKKPMGIAGDPAPVSAVMDMVAKGAGADKASVRAAEADFDEAAQGEPFTPDFPVPASPACADSPPAATPDS